QPDGLRSLTGLGPHLDPVTQQLIHLAVAVVEALAGVACRPGEQEQRPRDQHLVVTTLLAQEPEQQVYFDVPVAIAVGPVAEVVVAKLLAEQLDHALLRAFLPPAVSLLE